jgi:hypothetical protein
MDNADSTLDGRGSGRGSLEHDGAKKYSGQTQDLACNKNASPLSQLYCTWTILPYLCKNP